LELAAWELNVDTVRVIVSWSDAGKGGLLDSSGSEGGESMWRLTEPGHVALGRDAATREVDDAPRT
jgi:hypothetical protein